jgi:hypothetical protein
MRSVWKRAGYKRGKSRKLALALSELLLAFAVLAGVTHSGARYFYCEAIGLSASDPCAEASGTAGDADPCGTLREQPGDCCEVVTLPTLPDGARVATSAVPPAPSVATLPALWLADGPAAGVRPSHRDLFERWRVPPRSPSEARAQLMVFLT